jgi:hypothetical protein
MAKTLKLAAELGPGAEEKVLKLHVDRIIDPLNPRDVADSNEQVALIGIKLKVISEFDEDNQTILQARDEPSYRPSGWGFQRERRAKAMRVYFIVPCFRTGLNL